MASAVGCLDWPGLAQALTLEPGNMATSAGSTWPESGGFSTDSQGDVTRREWMLGGRK